MTEFVEVKTQELSGAALDWAVGKAEGLTVFVADPQYGNGHRVMIHGNRAGSFLAHQVLFNPSADWRQGGMLIERYRVDLIWERLGLMAAYLNDESGYPSSQDSYGPTHLIAACRAIVASVLGDTVSVPEELV